MRGRGRALAAACSTVALALAGFGAQTVVLSGSASAADSLDRYVSAANGKDSNDGTAGHPWATIAHAAAQDLPAGTTVHVADGTYTDPVENDNDGTASAYITFTTVNPGKVLINLRDDDNPNDFPFENSGDYVRITGFEVTAPYAKQGIHLSGDYNVVDHNEVHDIRWHVDNCNSSSAANGDALGDDSDTVGNSFIANIAHDVGPDGECEYAHGIYPSGTGDVMQNNIAYDNSGSGLRFNNNPVGATISNNLTFHNRQHGISISGDGDDDPSSGFVITNNIIVDNGRSGIYVRADADSDDNEYGHNLFHGNADDDFTNSDKDDWTPENADDELDEDPGLVDYASDGSGDYHLTADSPCVNAGTDEGAPDTDFDGVRRPQGDGRDIGPYEYVSDGGSGGGSGGDGGDGVTAGFEGGTTQNWSGYYGSASPVVTTDVAYEGTHALRFNLSSSGHSAVGTSTNLGAVTAGSTVTYHVYAAQSGTTVTPFVRDKSYTATMAGSVALTQGQWTTITWTVPSVSSVGAIGLDASSGTGTVAIDALTWPTS
ncbi:MULTISPECIES: right-handed parallel beta-helix repeat-containing protein [unclassified Streptomyces]|uniref:right-handed parallel beta-helix repeat-containing protein n=1 Tax=unclassified Streptomyces TaxID=2593676 RepID=UPI000FFE839A|nr:MULTISPECIES: right-handed parallel beta-helix repeat-containing protein [unclassified Streptomyces]